MFREEPTPVNSSRAGDPFISSFRELYKNSGKETADSREKRREDFLKRTKEKRAEVFEENRGIFDYFINPKRKHARYDHFIRKQFMYSELLLEIPADFHENWLVKVCVERQRFLLVAKAGRASLYSQNGKMCSSFRCPLSVSKNKITILDCVLNRQKNTIFVYDLLIWNGLSLINVRAEDRFNWLKSKFEEDPESLVINREKQFYFSIPKILPADLSIIQEELFNFSDIPCQGLLFYHKEGYYQYGTSPLVCWLKSYMIKEVLGIDVPELHLKNTPKDYKGLKNYLEKRSQSPVESMISTDDIEAGIEEIASEPLQNEVEFTDCDPEIHSIDD